MDRNKVKLTICGSDYVIVSEDSESYVRAIGDKVNDKMNSILSKNPKLSISTAALLSALEYCDENTKSIEKTENFRKQIKEYVSEVSKYKSKYESAEIEITNLRSKVESLIRSLDKYKEEIDNFKNNRADQCPAEDSKGEIVTLSVTQNEIADSI